jgi:hypothetical protein
LFAITRRQAADVQSAAVGEEALKLTEKSLIAPSESDDGSDDGESEADLPPITGSQPPPTTPIQSTERQKPWPAIHHCPFQGVYNKYKQVRNEVDTEAELFMSHLTVVDRLQVKIRQPALIFRS